MLASGVYCAAIFAVGYLGTRKVSALLPFAIMLMVLYLLAATVAISFSTFFHPLMASAAAGLFLGGEGLVARALGGPWRSLLPPWTLVDSAVNYGAPGWTAPWAACAAAVIHAVIFWIVASAIFARRDIAVALE